MYLKVIYDNYLEGEALLHFLDENGYKVSIEKRGFNPGKRSDQHLYVMDAVSARRYISSNNRDVTRHLRTIVVGKLEQLYIPFTSRFDRVAYVTKMDSITEMLHGMKAFKQKKIYVSQRVFGFLKRKRANQQDELLAANVQQPLTKTELKILQEISEKKTTREIAGDWNRSIHTINNHRKNIIRKLNLDGPHGLAVFAVREQEAIRTLTVLDSKQKIIKKLKNDYR
ncbi:response regulator transcription factor [Halalkalibaculum sp. DA3122]|uniref:response regulator transcription factor n=1 Tax=Halalkalibaculum sp. DA3122 TaxID=3373607 RepID=UPI00375504F6